MIAADDSLREEKAVGVALEDEAEKLLEKQCSDWKLAKENYAALQRVETKTLEVEGFEMHVQYNPSRIVSSGANVDAASIQKRACFLCQENRPLEQQEINWHQRYWLLVNPFPIFPKHLTIASVQHIEQQISGHFADMLRLSEELPSYVLFYNGPRCGASAPDHLHFQAGNKGFLPLEDQWSKWSEKAEVLVKETNFCLIRLKTYPHAVLVMETADMHRLVQWFNNLYHHLEIDSVDSEPMMNLLCSWKDGTWRVWIFLRSKHRPTCYFAPDANRMLISPAAVDLSGMVITPRYEDFQKITAEDLASIFHEVSMEESLFDRLCNSLKNFSGD